MSLSINVVDIVVAAFVTFFFGTFGGAVINWLFNRTGRKAEVARRKAEEEKRAEEIEQRKIEREELLAAARAKAQQTALESAHAAYSEVETRCNRCLSELEQMKESWSLERRGYEARIDRLERSNDYLIDAATETVPLLPADAEHTKSLRAAIQTARRSRYDSPDESSL